MDQATEHAIRYNDGWAAAKNLLAAGWAADEVLALYPLNETYHIGARDCIAQYLKTGKGEMIKSAVIIIVIDPDTGNVLAATRRGTTDDWGFIGGKTDGDAPLDAALREFEEETGWRLIAVPDYMGVVGDDQGWEIHTFIVLDSVEAKMICDGFRSGPKEVEPGIQVGLVPYREVITKTFGEFNIDLLPLLLKTLL